MDTAPMARQHAELQKQCFWSLIRRSNAGGPDILIRAGNYHWAVHMNLIVQESGHFRRLCEKGPKDSKEYNEQGMMLDDPPQNVGRMLVWLYDGPNFMASCGSVIHNLDPAFTFHDFMTRARIDVNKPADHACETKMSIIDHIDLFLMALKYDMPDFGDACNVHIEAALQKCSVQEFTTTAVHIQTLDERASGYLQKTVVKVASGRPQMLSNGGFKEYAIMNREFLWRLTVAMSNKKPITELTRVLTKTEEAKAASQTTGKGVKKRKVGD